MADVHPAAKALEEGVVKQVLQENDAEGNPISLQIVFKDGTHLTAGHVVKLGLDGSHFTGTLIAINGKKIIDK